MRQSALISLLFVAALPAQAEEGYLCRFDVSCTAGGCAPAEAEIEIARSAEAGAWIFLSAEAEGIEGLALMPAGADVQSFALHAPGTESALFTLYPDGRAIYSVHATDPATAPTQGFGACERASG